MIRTLLAHTLARLADWLRPKGMPRVLAGSQWSGTAFVDAYKRNRAPTPNEILAELKNTAWACASINAAVCASFPPRLYVATRPGQPRPRCLTRALPARTEQRLRSDPNLQLYTRAVDRIEEVADHPLLTLLAQVNPVHNHFAPGSPHGCTAGRHGARRGQPACFPVLFVRDGLPPRCPLVPASSLRECKARARRGGRPGDFPPPLFG